MKCSTVLLFSILIQGSFAGNNCKHNQKVNVTLLSELYREAVKYLPIPSIELGDNAAEYKKDYVIVGLNFAQSLVDLIYKRGLEIGEELIETVRKYSYELRKCIERKKENCSTEELTCVDEKLNQLTEQIQKFLDLILGEVLIKRSEEIPPYTTGIKSSTTKRSPEDIFLNFASVLDDDFYRFLNYSISIHTAGWSAAETHFNTQQIQYRNQILYASAMVAYRKSVEEVYQCIRKIRPLVKPETWKYFKVVGDQVIVASKRYKASLKHCTSIPRCFCHLKKFNY